MKEEEEYKQLLEKKEYADLLAKKQAQQEPSNLDVVKNFKGSLFENEARKALLPEVDPVEQTMRTAANVGTFGLSPYFEAAGQTALDAIQGKPTSYKDNVDMEQQREEATDNPYIKNTGTASKLVRDFMVPIGKASKASEGAGYAAKVFNYLKNAGKISGPAALIGMAEKAGQSDMTTPEGWKETATAGATNAVTSEFLRGLFGGAKSLMELGEDTRPYSKDYLVDHYVLSKANRNPSTREMIDKNGTKIIEYSKEGIENVQNRLGKQVDVTREAAKKLPDQDVTNVNKMIQDELENGINYKKKNLVLEKGYSDAEPSTSYIEYGNKNVYDPMSPLDNGTKSVPTKSFGTSPGEPSKSYDFLKEEPIQKFSVGSNDVADLEKLNNLTKDGTLNSPDVLDIVRDLDDAKIEWLKVHKGMSDERANFLIKVRNELKKGPHSMNASYKAADNAYTEFKDLEPVLKDVDSAKFKYEGKENQPIDFDRPLGYVHPTKAGVWDKLQKFVGNQFYKPGDALSEELGRGAPDPYKVLDLPTEGFTQTKVLRPWVGKRMDEAQKILKTGAMEANRSYYQNQDKPSDRAARSIPSILKTHPEVFGKFSMPLQDAAQRGPEALNSTIYLLSEQNPEFRQLKSEIEGE